MSVWFFGCVDVPGHRFLGPRRPGEAMFNSVGPFPQVDGQLTPRSTTEQGAGLLHHVGGWTALAVHDYTGDSRGGSNSVFFVDAVVDLDGLLDAVRAVPRMAALLDRIGTIRLVDA